MSRPRPGLAALLATAALALAACGGDDAATTTVAGGDGATKRVIVESPEGAFDAEAVYAQAAPGVVTVRSIFTGAGSSVLGQGGGQAQGSGFVVSDGGEILTNAHVITDGEAGGGTTIRQAKEVYVQLADRNQLPARIVGFDAHADVALLEVDPEGLDLRPLELATEQEISVGQPVAAIGSPFGEARSLSVGVVSATDRSIQSLTDFQIDGAIQTDASINPGNSGGPLLDAEARVIGINQQINTTSGGNEGVGFAVPVDLVSRSLEQLREGGTVDYAYLGVTTQPLYPQLAERLDLPTETGALIARVVPNGPADDAGLEGADSEVRFQGSEVRAGGDVIVAVDGHEVVDASDLSTVISRLDPGETISVEVFHDGGREEVAVELGARPDSVG